MSPSECREDRNSLSQSGQQAGLSCSEGTVFQLFLQAMQLVPSCELLTLSWTEDLTDPSLAKTIRERGKGGESGGEKERLET